MSSKLTSTPVDVPAMLVRMLACSSVGRSTVIVLWPSRAAVVVPHNTYQCFSWRKEAMKPRKRDNNVKRKPQSLSKGTTQLVLSCESNDDAAGLETEERSGRSMPARVRRQTCNLEPYSRTRSARVDEMAKFRGSRRWCATSQHTDRLTRSVQ